MPRRGIARSIARTGIRLDCNHVLDVSRFFAWVSTASAQASWVLYFRFAAEKGHRNAWINVAYMYEKGVGITQNFAEAVHWYRRAAEDGHLESQYRLGRHFYRVIGIKRDLRAAAAWVQKAATGGHAASQHSLG